MSTGAALWISLGLLLANAFFVGAEFAAMAARRSALEPLAAAGSRRARTCLDAMEQMGSMLATAQLGITVCSVGLGALAEVALHHLFVAVFERFGLSPVWAGAAALAAALLIVVYLHVVVGEMIPKNVAIAGPERSALVLVPALLWVSKALGPLVRLMAWFAKTIVRWLGIEPKDEITSTFTADEVGHIVAASRAEGLLEEADTGLVRSSLEFSDKVAADVAVPLAEVVTVEENATPAQIERLVARHGYSRYPVTDDTGEVASYLHLKDVLDAGVEAYTEPVPLHRFRRLATVGPAAEVEEVLEVMQRTGAHLARVVGPAGAVTGVVFLEDVIEVLVGEVTDSVLR